MIRSRAWRVRRSPAALTLGAATALFKVGAGMLALALLVRPARRPVLDRLPVGANAVLAALLLAWGGANVVGGSLSLAGAVSPADGIDERALLWHVLVWDLWFVAWGAALTGAIVYYRGATASGSPGQRMGGSIPAAERTRDCLIAPPEDEGAYPYRQRRGQATLERHQPRRKLMSAIASSHNSIRQNLSGRSREPTRLLVVDDHAAVRVGIRDMLADEPDFEVVAAVATAEEGLSVAERKPIDLAVVDYQLGGRTGLWLSRKLKRLRQPPGVVIYSAYADDVLSAAAVVAEADGIVSKSGLGSELCDAIRAVARGGHRLRPVPPWLSEGLRHRLGHEEQAIFGLLLAGIPRDEIAQTLGISTDGLDARLWAMMRTLESPRAEAPAQSIARNVAWR